jgi:hypothetical protein
MVGGGESMEESKGFSEKRKHLRAPMQTIVVGILNSKAPETIGTITDISLGGVKCSYYVHKIKPNKRSSFNSIDLIAGSLYVLEIPCRFVWDGEMDLKSNTKWTMLKQCGIQFGELAPIQTYMLRKFIDICVSEGIKSFMPRSPITIAEERPSYTFLETN